MTTDPISDMLTSIRNAQAVSHQTVTIPFSILKYKIVKVLEKQGFVEKVEKKGKKVRKIIEIVLKYKNKEPIISGIRRVSKPGQRIYISVQEIRKVRGGYGMTIISTSKGLMTNKEAKKNKLGGEVLCELW